eukprot:GHVS01106581.1.p1 GENE.GHVS01106581.1~~GHVS01106581.1.p1  ORF type:complete len:739 (-),score=198.08 GHVS01106581.1:1067-3139(-)
MRPPSCDSHHQQHRYCRRSWCGVAVALAACCVGGGLLLLHGVVDDFIDSWTELKTAEEKMDLVWNKMEANREPEPWVGLAELLIRGFYLQTDQTERLSNRNTFRPFSNKKKFLHTQGAHVRIRWKAVPNVYNYTGLFGAALADGTATFSKGSRIVSNSSASWGMGLKLLRDNGVPAATVFCSPSTLLGQLTAYNWNMLDAPLCGHVDIFLGAILLQIARKRPKVAKAEQLWTRYGNGPGISNFADIDEFNTTQPNPKFPFTICMRAPTALSRQFANTPAWFNPIEQLRAIPPDTLLYEVIAIDSPEFLPDVFNMNTNAVKIGEVWTSSEFITSRWADNHWTYQHQKFEEDLALRPDWKPFMTLRHLLMDGYGYAPLYEGRQGGLKNMTVKEVASNYAPGFIGIIQILTNPAATYQFLSDDLGIKHLQQLAQSVLLGMYFSPNPNKPGGRRLQQEVGEAVALGWSSSLQQMLTQFVGASLFPGVPLFPAADKLAQEEEEEGEKKEEGIVAVTDNVGGGDVMRDSAGKLFDLPAHMADNNVSSDEQQQTMNFIKTLAPQLVFDGHFIRPTNIAALQNILDDPVVRDVGVVVLQQYSEQFGSDFVTDVTQALFRADGLSDVEGFVTAVFNSLEVTEKNEEEGAPGPIRRRRRQLTAAAEQSVVTKSFRRLIDRLVEPMNKLGDVRLYPDIPAT